MITKFDEIELDQVKGAIVGFTIGDAIGAPVEFQTDVEPVSGFRASPKKGLAAGQYTDDAQQLLLSLDSLIENDGEINIADHATKLRALYNSNQIRSVGYTTRSAIERLNQGVPPNKSGATEEKSCGSFALARLLPHSIYSAFQPADLKLTRGDMRRILGITHAHKKVERMGHLLTYIIQDELHETSVNVSVHDILHEDSFLNKKYRTDLARTLKYAEDSGLDYREAIERIGTSGFVDHVVHTAIYCCMKGESYQDVVLMAANGGGDTDTRAAVAGALAGLQYGLKGIPKQWVDKVESKDELLRKSDELFRLATSYQGP